MTRYHVAIAVFLLASTTAVLTYPAQAARVQELCEIEGVRANQLVGYGLVVGLDGTGDRGQARFTVQSTAAMLRRLGATIDPRSIQTKNAAAVVVTATLPAHSNPGNRIDVTVSSLGNARSLEGGTLIQTPLFGADREVYAVAQGPLIVGGFSAGGGSGSSVTRNHVTAGRVPQGAIVERRVTSPHLNREHITLTLRNPSFVMANEIAQRINDNLRPEFTDTESSGHVAAAALDSGTVRIRVPENFSNNQVGFIARISGIDVVPTQPTHNPRVVIDERSGTVVIGGGVRISEVAVAQGGVTIEVRERPAVSQPNALGQGETVTVPDTEIEVQEQGTNGQDGRGSLRRLPAGADLSSVVEALNRLGASPRDLISILQALHTAGALQAEIEVQ